MLLGDDSLNFDQNVKREELSVNFQQSKTNFIFFGAYQSLNLPKKVLGSPGKPLHSLFFEGWEPSVCIYHLCDCLITGCSRYQAGRLPRHRHG